MDREAEAEARRDPQLLDIASIIAGHVPWRRATGPARDVLGNAKARNSPDAEHVANLLGCVLEWSVAVACAPEIVRALGRMGAR
jgi:hypothetical protein